MLFVDTCGWALEVTDGRERDAFDTPAALYCGLYHDRQLVGGFRAIRTDGGVYLARSAFSQLASTRPFPVSPDVWEISRFGVRPNGQPALARVAYSVMLNFARLRGSAALVAVTDLSHERLLSILGVRTRRYGPPQTVGLDVSGRPITAVAGEIPLREQSGPRFAALVELARNVEIKDEALVLGSQRIPA